VSQRLCIRAQLEHVPRRVSCFLVVEDNLDSSLMPLEQLKLEG
jgi:hypothetical protein